MSTETEKRGAGAAVQKTDFKSGNEMAALAARQIDYHLMGFYPITPSTEIAEEIDATYAEGLHHIKMIPAEGEHSAAGICYGASTAGGRVLNATSSQGLLYSLEQLPVQSSTRFPMVLNNDEAVVKACTLTSWRATPEETRLCVIRNTLELNEILVSQPLLDDIEGQEGVEVLSAPYPLAFDDDSVLLSRI